MVIGGASMAIASMWAFMATLSTPTVLFCILHIMIATIFIASNFKSHNHHPHTTPSQLTRPPSFLERVRSVNLSSFHYTTELSHNDEHGVDHNESTRYNSPSQLNRVPSFLQRVKSFKLASVLTSDHHSGDTFSSQDQCSDIDMGPHQDPVDDMSEDSGATPAKNLSGNLVKSSSEKRAAPELDDEKEDVDLRRPATMRAKKSSGNLVKSTSERRAAPELDDEKEDVDRRRPATMKASAVVHDECVDAKADDFIRRFKQQLKLQRIDSLRRFRDMMNRGTSSG